MDQRCFCSFGVFFLIFTWSATVTFSQDSNYFWAGLGKEKPALLRNTQENIKTAAAFYFQVNQDELLRFIQEVPKDEFRLTLPNPEGRPITFLLDSYNILEEGLSQKYPQIKTYRGRSAENPDIKIYLTYSPYFFQASVSGLSGQWYIDTYTWPASTLYQSYYTVDEKSKEPFGCSVDHHERTPQVQIRNNAERIENIRRNYRLAVSVSYSYHAYFGRNLDRTMTGIMAAVNRLNMITENDLGIRFVLVADNDQLIVTDPDDSRFTSNDLDKMFAENQDWINSVIGSLNYDIGHVFIADNLGGKARLGGVCDLSDKAHGISTSYPPESNDFITLIAHEIGHQFGANHTFNGVIGPCSKNRNGGTAFEPGAGTTIMSYAGICGSDNITSLTSSYFHGGSIAEINRFLEDSERNCAQIDNIVSPAPVIELAPDDKYIPILTPFELSAKVKNKSMFKIRF